MMQSVDVSELAHVTVEMSYTKPVEGPANVLVFPSSSGRKIESPERERVSVPGYDCRPIVDELTLDEAGFQVLSHRSAFNDYYDPERVQNEYYPESIEPIKQATGAAEMFIFDHNVRNQPRSDEG